MTLYIHIVPDDEPAHDVASSACPCGVAFGKRDANEILVFHKDALGRRLGVHLLPYRAGLVVGPEVW